MGGEGWREGMERQGCVKVREKCERGRQGLRGRLREGERAASARLNTVSESSGLQGSCGCDSCGNSWPLIL